MSSLHSSEKEGIELQTALQSFSVYSLLPQAVSPLLKLGMPSLPHAYHPNSSQHLHGCGCHARFEAFIEGPLEEYAIRTARDGSRASVRKPSLVELPLAKHGCPEERMDQFSSGESNSTDTLHLPAQASIEALALAQVPTSQAVSANLELKCCL